MRAAPRLFENVHVSKLPPTTELVGREMDFTCWECGAGYRLEYYLIDGKIMVPSGCVSGRITGLAPPFEERARRSGRRPRPPSSRAIGI
jgi:hypothetical protein